MLINKKNFLSILLLSYQFSLLSQADSGKLLNVESVQNKDLESLSVEGVQSKEVDLSQSVEDFSDNVNNNTQVVNFRDCTPDEIDEFRKSLTPEEVLVFKEFMEEIHEQFRLLINIPKLKDVEEICKKYDISLRVGIQFVPSKLVYVNESDDVQCDQVFESVCENRCSDLQCEEEVSDL